LKVPLPPLPIQKRIAEILDAADALKRKDQELLKKYDALAQAIFIDMFGDPVKNEKGWEVKKLGDYISVLTDYHSNGSYETLREHVTLRNVPDHALMVRTTDLEKNNFTDNVNYISKEAYEHLDKSKIFGGEIIINKIGSAGNLYLMPFLNRPVSLGMNAFLVRLNESLNPVFAFHFLNTDFGKNEISKRVFGAVTKTITKDAVRSIPMFKIPRKEQELYVECITYIKSLINCGNALQSDLLFQTLLQKAFKGELVE
ncbi:MAG: restriction endonuclease subunit S, partial [Paludibacter sp.]|nr:restriction endonuclease subunit S [Paludibacter sp.]